MPFFWRGKIQIPRKESCQVGLRGNNKQTSKIKSSSLGNSSPKNEGEWKRGGKIKSSTVRWKVSATFLARHQSFISFWKSQRNNDDDSPMGLFPLFYREILPTGQLPPMYASVWSLIVLLQISHNTLSHSSTKIFRKNRGLFWYFSERSDGDLEASYLFFPMRLWRRSWDINYALIRG